MRYHREFPDFNPATMPDVPSDFVDVSWRDDACPQFNDMASMLALFVEHENPRLRETMGPRYRLCEIVSDCEIRVLVVTDNWTAVLAAIDRHKARQVN